MGQQPNVEIDESMTPSVPLNTGPAKAWRASKPGVPAGPADVPRGGMFGTPGPDPGWAVKLVAKAKLPDDDPRLRDVVTGLVIARAAAFGRAAVKEDIDAALVLCGYGDESRPELAERRRRWLAATAHDSRLGATAVAEIDPHVITAKPEQIRYAHRLQERSGRESEPEASGDAG